MITTQSSFIYGHTIDNSNFYFGIDEGSGEILVQLNSGAYTLTGFADELGRALNEYTTVTNNYSVTIDRVTRRLTVSADNGFDILVSSSSQVLNSAYTLAGFTGDDLIGIIAEINYSYTFDGTEHISVPHNATLDNSDNISVSLWLNADDLGAQNNYPLAWWGSSGQRAWCVQVAQFSGDIDILISENGSVFSSTKATATITLGEDQHIGFTFAGGTLKTYINGAPDNTTVIPQTFIYTGGTTALTFGGLTPSSPDYIGRINEVSVHDVVLNPADFVTLYNGGIPLNLTAHVLLTDTVGYWRMGDNLSGLTEPDNSANTNDGTLSGMDNSNLFLPPILSTFEGDNSSGSIYNTQFRLQSFVSFEDQQGKQSAMLNTPANGAFVEVISYGSEKIMECEIKWATNYELDKSSEIRENLTGISDLRTFMLYLISKAPIEIMLDEDTPNVFTKAILDRTAADSKGTKFKLKEDKQWKETYSTGLIKFREVS